MTEITRLSEKLRVAREAIEVVFSAWPEIRQLIDGWKSGTPTDEWSEWDEFVRLKTMELSFTLTRALSALDATQPEGIEGNAQGNSAAGEQKAQFYPHPGTEDSKD